MWLLHAARYRVRHLDFRYYQTDKLCRFDSETTFSAFLRMNLVISSVPLFLQNGTRLSKKIIKKNILIIQKNIV